MENISPLLQAKINEQKLNNSSDAGTFQQINLSQKPDTVELSTKSDSKGKKILKIGAIIASILAVAAGGFALAKKGVFGQNLKTGADKIWSNITSIFKKAPEQPQIEPKPQVESSTPAENIKKFISNGSEIQGVKLEQGKAILEDGSLFTGSMETVTKSGKKVLIDYENGFMTQSIINDNLHKTYSNPSLSDRTRGALIRQFDETGKVTRESYNFLNNEGKLSKIMTRNISLDSRGYEYGCYDVLEFSPNGKKIAQYQTRHDFSLKKGKIFNEDGSVKKEIQNLGSEYRETIPLDDGSKVKKIGKGYIFEKDINEQIATKEISYPNDISFIDKEGNLERRYFISQSGRETRLEINPDDRYNQIEMRVPYTTKLRGQNESLSDNFAQAELTRDVEGDEGQMQALTILDDAVKNRKINTELATRGFTKDELLSTISELERGVKVAEDNNMLRVLNRDGCEVSYERFRNYIQRLKEFADGM